MTWFRTSGTEAIKILKALASVLQFAAVSLIVVARAFGRCQQIIMF